MLHNVNADTAAAALAVALGAGKLVVLTDVRGPLRRLAGHRSRRHQQIDADELETLLPSLRAGMVPKMEACLRAVRGGVPRAHVVDGRVAALAAARGLHRRGIRHDGGAGRVRATTRSVLAGALGRAR